MPRTREFDLIVIGSGAGMNVASNAAAHGMRVALVDNGPLGGTCLNRGCVPSKVMIYPADLLRTVEEATSIGLQAPAQIDFGLVMQRAWDIVLEDRQAMERGAAQSDNLAFFNTDGTFVSDYTLQVGQEQITSETIVIASGARPFIPSVEGLEAVGYLTSRTVFDLKSPPVSLIIVGGGYIAAEFGHLFSAVGTKVTILGRNERLVPDEEPEISSLLLKKMAEYCEVHTGLEAIRAGRELGLKTIVARDRHSAEEQEFSAEEILIAAGRRSNSDILQPEKSGVSIDNEGWITVDPYLRTTQEGIWAMGDALGRHMFRHTANYHAQIVWTNAFGEHQHEVEEHAVPHAVFSHPQIASVGLSQQQAEERHNALVGFKRYGEVAKGYAMGEEDGFVKVVVDEETYAILGAHIIGPHAAMLLQPLVYLMNTSDRTFIPLARAQTIHPALSEVVVGAFGNLRPVGVHKHNHHDH